MKIQNAVLGLILSTLFSWSAFGFEVLVDSPRANRKMTSGTLIELERKLGPNRWVQNRDCSLSANKRTVERKFLKGSYNADVIFLDFETAHLGPRKAQAVITMDSKWGTKLATDPEFGPIEIVKIELNDKNSTWLEFRHTGTHLVQFEIGNILGLTLCLVR